MSPRDMDADAEDVARGLGLLDAELAAWRRRGLEVGFEELVRQLLIANRAGTVDASEVVVRGGIARPCSGNRTAPPPDPGRAQRLRAARVAAGLTQFRLAALTGCATGTISLAERGGTLTPALAERLAGALGLTAEELLR